MVTTPVFVPDGDWLFIFESVERARERVTWADLDDGRYRAFDGDGRLIEFEVRNVRRRVLGLVLYRQTKLEHWRVDSEPRHAEELRAALMGALAGGGEAPGRDDSLATLEELAVERYGFA
jgi:hypothetical protein